MTFLKAPSTDGAFYFTIPPYIVIFAEIDQLNFNQERRRDMVTINKERFKEVFRAIFIAYRDKTGVFANVTAETLGPQHRFRPKKIELGSKDHLYWLALVALSDKRTNSTVLYRCFARMFSDHRSLFKRGVYPSLNRMTKLFRKYTIALPVMEIAFFIERKRHLDELFDGDPLSIYNGVADIDALMRKLQMLAKEKGIKNPFPGAKTKIFSLLAMFLSELTDLQFADIVPIDVWVQSISSSAGILEGTGNIKVRDLERQLRPLMTDLFKEFRHVKGAPNATWIQGKLLCTHCHRLNMCKACSVYGLCNGPFTRMRHPVSDKHYGSIMVPSPFIPRGSNPY